MDNFYYYSFYLLAKFAHWIKKSDKDFAFTAVILISTPTSMNLVTLAFLCGGITYHAPKASVSISAIILSVPILAINYFLFRYNKKNEQIIAYFDEKYKDKKNNLLVILVLIAYFVLSFAFGVHLANRNRAIAH